MTEARKQELSQLLEEAMDGLQIGVRLGGSSLLLSPTTDSASKATQVYFGSGSLPLSRVKLQNYLQKRWTSYGVDSSSVLMDLELYIASDITKSKLFEFIREELAPFTHEDKLNSTSSSSYAISDDNDDGFRLYGIRGGSIHLSYLLRHLLNIAIAWGIEKAVSTFDEGSCLNGKQSFYQDIASLEGIVVESEIQVCEGVRLVPLPQPTTFEFYFPEFSIRDSRFARDPYMGKTLLIIDLPLLSIFHKPSEKTFDEVPVGELPFHIETQDFKFPNHEAVDSFRTSFCQVLSLACDSAVQIARRWWFVAEDDLFHPFHGGSMQYSPRLFGSSIEVGQSEIDKAKCLYGQLKNFNSKTQKNSETQKKLQIAIARWIKSKANKGDVDKMIDLGVALEALFLPKNKTDQLSLSLRLRAAWHLGENKAHRKELIDEFDAIYTLRSQAVHNGELSLKVKVRKESKVKQGKSIPTSEFIPRAQELCRDSIIKILKAGEFPDDDYWKDLILGEESS